MYEEGHNPDSDGAKKYVEVTDETEEAQGGDFGNGYEEGEYAHNPQYYLYCDPDSGKVSKSCWINAKPPGKDESEDDRSLIVDSLSTLIADEAVKNDTLLRAVVSSFYAGIVCSVERSS